MIQKLTNSKSHPYIRQKIKFGSISFVPEPKTLLVESNFSSKDVLNKITHAVEEGAFSETNEEDVAVNPGA